MNKAQLVERLADREGIAKNKAESILETTIDEILSSLQAGEDVRLVGFGTFSRVKRKARVHRNPQTGEKVPSDPYRTVKFKVSTVLRGWLNE